MVLSLPPLLLLLLLMFVGCALLKNVTFDFIMRRPLVSNRSNGSSANIKLRTTDNWWKKWCKTTRSLFNKCLYLKKEDAEKNGAETWQVPVQRSAAHVNNIANITIENMYDYLSGWLAICLSFSVSRSVPRTVSICTSLHLFVVMVRKTMYISTYLSYIHMFSQWVAVDSINICDSSDKNDDEKL